LGFIELTEVQDLAVKAGLFDKKSIFISAPTNTGKTFVGELAVIVAATRREYRRSFFLVPLKALAEEKFEEFRQKYADWGLSVAISTSDRTQFDGDLLTYDVVIATYEKLMAIIVRHPEVLREIGVVVVDELQNVNDANRGPTVEMLLTRLLVSGNRPQIIGLSATIPNAKDLAGWLEAELVQTRKRDVELREGIEYTGTAKTSIAGVSLAPKDFVYKEFNTNAVGKESNLDFGTIEGIAVASEKEQFLVFTSTQRDAEEIARILAESLPKTTGTLNLIEELDASIEPTPSTRALMRDVENGVAFHHAGLLAEERVIVERGFREGKLRIICATTTLGAGVNTPAKNVVFRSHQTFDSRNLAVRDYKNMAGRAGRLRKDSFGRSVLFASNEKELEMLWQQFVNSVPEQVVSQLPKGKRLDSLILGLVASGAANGFDQIMYFIKMTLFGYTSLRKADEAVVKPFEEAVRAEIGKLEKTELIELRDGNILVTEVGRRCAEEMATPMTAAMIYASLKASLSKIKGVPFEKTLQGMIHLACCTPNAAENSALLFKPYSQAEIDELGAYWTVYGDSFFYKPTDSDSLIRTLRTTRMLMRWIEGEPFSDLRQYAPHGILKRNAEVISWLLRVIARISDKPTFDFGDTFQDDMRHLVDRVFYGVPADALPLMRLGIPLVNRNRAIQLVKSGFITIDNLLDASTESLVRVPGIDEKTALSIKQSVERYIPDLVKRSQHSQIRRAEQMKKNTLHLKRLYEAKAEDFSRACVDVLKDMGLDAKFLGNTSRVDGLITTTNGQIALECKRKEKENVGAKDAEEVLGKAAEFRPIAHVTIGYPGFTHEAGKNCVNSKVTLIPLPILGELLIGFWTGEFSSDRVLELLFSAKHVLSIPK
jgi:helicase